MREGVRRVSEPIIRVENLGKKYLIRHQQQEPYTALRDVITNSVKSWGRTLVNGKEEKLENPSQEEFWALKDVSFEMKRGDVVGIIGRNGAGKSTLLKILSRITEPTCGRATIKGRVASLLEVGTGFHGDLTGRENIFLNGAILGMGKQEIRKKFDEIVSFSEVEKFIDTPVKRYSSGMYVRLAFGVAAHLEPEILIVDEVLAVGDTQFQKKCLGKMADISEQEGRTVFFVSHNLASVKTLCQQAILLESGHIVYQGDPHSCIEKYISNVSLHNVVELETDKIERHIKEYGTDLRIIKVKVESASENGMILFGTPITVKIVFKVNKPLIDVVWSFSLETLDSTRVVDCMSIQSILPTCFSEKGVYTSQGTLEVNPIRPGTYKLLIGAGTPQRGLDWLSETIKLVIYPKADNESSLLMTQPGLVWLNSTWTEATPMKTYKD